MLSRRELLAATSAGLVAAPRLAADTPPAPTDPTRVLPPGQKSTDARLGPPKTLNDDFPFAVPATKAEWEARRKRVREQVLVAAGLWPMPEKGPLDPTIHGTIARDGYTIEKVSFRSLPGHYVTGNLYRPPLSTRGVIVPRPAVLFAHGHWKGGRFDDAGEKAAAAAVKRGEDDTLDAARFPLQALPASLAKLGYVVFAYDMVGYADSTALPHREGFKDARAELRLQSFFGLQTWNSVRALDFLSGLPDVDPKRIGMTGASGGATQTFILGAIDDRLAAMFPAVMVGTAMQGGCVCENASYLRVGTGNVELAALFAPKPLAMSAANDWTKDLMTKGFPELKKLYELYGAEDKVAARAWLEFGHQYNQRAREFMYSWFDTHLRGSDKPATEPPFKPVIPPTDLGVYDATHPRPTDEANAEKLRETLTAASDAQLAKVFPDTPEKLTAFREVVGTALRVMVGDYDRRSAPFSSTHRAAGGFGGAGVDQFVFRRARKSGDVDVAADAVPAVAAQKPGAKGAVVWVHPRGKASLVDGTTWNPQVAAILDKGLSVLAVDVLQTGEQVGPPRPVTTPTYNHVYAGYTYGYNRPLLADRVRDVLLFARAVTGEQPLYLVGWGEMGPVAVLAKALAGDAVSKLAADLNGFRFEDVAAIDHPMMLPGAVKYGGLSAFLALCAPGEVLVHNNKGTGAARLAKPAYAAAGAANKFTHAGDKLDDAKVVEWLLR